MSQGQDPTDELYRQYHQNQNANGNIFEFYAKKIAELKVQVQILTKSRDELERKLKEHEPPKKAPNTK